MSFTSITWLSDAGSAFRNGKVHAATRWRCCCHCNLCWSAWSTSEVGKSLFSLNRSHTAFFRVDPTAALGNTQLQIKAMELPCAQRLSNEPFRKYVRGRSRRSGVGGGRWTKISRFSKKRTACSAVEIINRRRGPMARENGTWQLCLACSTLDNEKCRKEYFLFFQFL